MMKRVIALVLCLLMLIPAFASCAKKDENDKGAYINMYLSDIVYDLDPARAFNNEAALKVVSLVFDNLFVLDENGKVKKSLADSYVINEDDNTEEYEMIITLKETSWTDGTPITANDVYYAWRRLLDPNNNFEAASLLYDIKYAREAKEGEGEISIDDVCMSAINETQIRIEFDGKIDYDQFLLKLTSYALAPLREEIVSKTEDWAKKPATICSSGPFKLRQVSYVPGEEKLILERNIYYYRDIAKDDLDKSVTPYRITVDYSMTDEEIMQAYNDGKLFFVGDIPLSVRSNYADTAEIKDALSTHIYVLNQNALINGDALFANAKVREALSLAIDRTAIADAVVFAKAASALVPYGVYDTNSKKDLFREVGGDILATTADMTAAKAALAESGITASKYSFSISVPAYDEVHIAIAEMVCTAWNDLGFNVSVKKVNVKENEEILKTTGEVNADIMDDIFAQDFRAGKFEVAAIDYVSFSADAFTVLAPFAKGFTGGSTTKEDSRDFTIPNHISGYASDEYNQLIEDAFAQKDLAVRAEILHEAEELIMKELPIIPIIYNQTATLQHDDLSKVKFTYYGTFNFTKTKLKDYELYIPVED
ncbi:MAG: hypothetical protein J6U86_05295 [Clostridia bacterium]|nr:hypothetical protein [Clostridia bacterium]